MAGIESRMAVIQPLKSVHARPSELISGRLLATNAIWNLVGACAPVLVAIPALPLLKTGLGTDRLGIITLAWAIIGYAGLFDLGISRALTKLVAEKLGKQCTEEIPPLFWTSLTLMATFGMAGALLGLALAPWLVFRLLKVPVFLQIETLHSFYWLSLAIPVVVVTAGLRGFLEALQQFRLATAIRIPLGIFTYLGPVLILPFSHSLAAVLAVLFTGRALAGMAHLWACFRVFPLLRHNYRFPLGAMGSLLRFGAWMTVSNIVSPLMVSFDRLLIGACISVSAVAYYSVPYEVVTRLSFVPGALAGVPFPAFSTALESDPKRFAFLYESGIKYIYLVLFPVTLLLIAFAPEILQIWVGTDFARNSAPVARWLAAAVFVNSLSQMPFTHLQGAGRPDITAKMHLLELPVYAWLLFFLARKMGITGVALAWFLRVMIDSALLCLFSWRLSRESRFIAAKLPLMALVALAAFAAATHEYSLAIKIAFAAGTCAIAIPWMWFGMLSAQERKPLLAGLR